MKIRYKSRHEIELMREASLVVAEILDVLCEAVAPGISTWDLDQIARDKIKEHGVKSAFLGYYDYPGVVCTSVNEVVVHGIPRKDVILEQGDLISIDFGVFKHGFCGDSARTISVGPMEAMSEERRSLIEVTRDALQRGIEQCYDGNRLEDIGFAIQNYVEDKGFSVVKSFVGHGIGKEMHEEPPVPNYGKANKGKRLKTGLVIAVEPMVNAGTHEVQVLEDKWTAVTKDRRNSAHFEHTIAITDRGPWVLSRPSSTPGNPSTDAG